MMGFLWKLFSKGLSPLLSVLGLIAVTTKKTWDDDAVAWAKDIGEIFIPGTPTADNTGWEIDPVSDPSDKGIIVRSVGAVVVKKLFTNPEFLRACQMNETQAGHVLVSALSYLKPAAVDTAEEVAALLEEAGRAATQQ